MIKKIESSCVEPEPQPEPKPEPEPVSPSEDDDDKRACKDGVDRKKGNLFVENSGFATTTRFWNCKGGECGCGYQPGNSQQHRYCNANAMFEAPKNNPRGAKFYGTAAVSNIFMEDGGYSNKCGPARGCGSCWQITAFANVPGFSSKTSIILKATDYCDPKNEACSGNKKHFDIAAPGFDQPGASLNNVCSKVTIDPALKPPQTCGFWMKRSQNPNEECDCGAIQNPVLKRGCQNFKSLGWNNPKVEYNRVQCPPELARIPCFRKIRNNEINTNKWPLKSSLFCSVNDAPN